MSLPYVKNMPYDGIYLVEVQLTPSTKLYPTNHFASAGKTTLPSLSDLAIDSTLALGAIASIYKAIPVEIRPSGEYLVLCLPSSLNLVICTSVQVQAELMRAVIIEHFSIESSHP